jgi:hypothetical protein
MGLISAGDVLDFFILKNLEPVGKESNGRPMSKAEKTRITIGAEGPGLPDIKHSQRKFNRGTVVVVEHGETRISISSAS